MPVWKTFGCSAFAACTAEIATLPIDTAKVRLQIQSAPAPGMQPKYRGMVGTCMTIAKEEGVAALWAGLTPGLHRCSSMRPTSRTSGQHSMVVVFVAIITTTLLAALYALRTPAWACLAFS